VELENVYFSQSTYDFSNSGIAIFGFDFDHSYWGWDGRSAESYGDVFFTLTDEVRYEFAGSYTAGADDPNDILTVIVSLSSTHWQGPTLYQETDRLSPMETAVLDGVPVGLGSSVTGSPTGVLAPGSYQLSYRFILYDNLDFNGSASGEGGFTFTLVPEPSTTLLLGIGLTGLAAARRRRSLH
jgi:hypothetical protein